MNISSAQPGRKIEGRSTGMARIAIDPGGRDMGHRLALGSRSHPVGRTVMTTRASTNTSYRSGSVVGMEQGSQPGYAPLSLVTCIALCGGLNMPHVLASRGGTVVTGVASSGRRRTDGRVVI